MQLNSNRSLSCAAFTFIHSMTGMNVQHNIFSSSSLPKFIHPTNKRLACLLLIDGLCHFLYITKAMNVQFFQILSHRLECSILCVLPPQNVGLETLLVFMHFLYFTNWVHSHFAHELHVYGISIYISILSHTRLCKFQSPIWCV